MEDFLYIAGLVLVLLYLAMGVDDFLWDLVAVAHRLRGKKKNLDMAVVNQVPPKLIAVMIAAWHEDNVLGEVIENFINSTIYPTSMYHVFLGVYPNDEATVQVAQNLARQFPNVHPIVNCQPGPSSKAQNINHVIGQILAYEQESGLRFATFTVHDSEDVVHPYELKVTNYLIEHHKAVQFPVFPLMEMPSLKNFFKNITTSTYADEFAENHYLTMVNRNSMGAFVPSAGTGFTLTRGVIEMFPDGEVLPKNSLTEDYRLSLTLYEKNVQLYYALERFPRVNERREVVYDYVSTRSMFPDTFATAVRQKTRWIMGITMQSVKIREVLSNKGLTIAGRYSLYKDQKAKVGNLLTFVGYPVLIYFLLSLFTTLPPIYPMFSLSWYLSLLVTIMMLERQTFRAVSIYHVYGLRSVFYACLFPPVLPIRIIWGNVINFTATVKSYRRQYFGYAKAEARKKERAAKRKPEESKPVKWDKTDHAFLAKGILRRYHRKLGDILLEGKTLTPDRLMEALEGMEREESAMSLGQYLLEREYITEEQLLEGLGRMNDQVFFLTEDFREFTPVDLSLWTREFLMESKLLPLMSREGERVIAVSEYTSPEVTAQLMAEGGTQFCLATASSILRGIDGFLARGEAGDRSPVEAGYQRGELTAQQALLAKRTAKELDMAEENAMVYMGLKAAASRGKAQPTQPQTAVAQSQ